MTHTQTNTQAKEIICNGVGDNKYYSSEEKRENAYETDLAFYENYGGELAAEFGAKVDIPDPYKYKVAGEKGNIDIGGGLNSKADYEHDLRWFEEMEAKNPTKGGLKANEDYQSLKEDYESLFKTKWNSETENPVEETTKKSSPVVDAADEIKDYLYHDTDREIVSETEIRDYINNEILDNELKDYRASEQEYEDLINKLKEDGYKVARRVKPGELEIGMPYDIKLSKDLDPKTGIYMGESEDNPGVRNFYDKSGIYGLSDQFIKERNIEINNTENYDEVIDLLADIKTMGSLGHTPESPVGQALEKNKNLTREKKEPTNKIDDLLSKYQKAIKEEEKARERWREGKEKTPGEYDKASNKKVETRNALYKEFVGTIPMEELYETTKKIANIPDLEFESKYVEPRNGGDGSIVIRSKGNLKNNMGTFGKTLKSAEISTFNTSVYIDRETGEPRYWGSLDVRYEHNDGGSNGSRLVDMRYDRKNGWTISDSEGNYYDKNGDIIYDEKDYVDYLTKRGTTREQATSLYRQQKNKTLANDLIGKTYKGKEILETRPGYAEDDRIQIRTKDAGWRDYVYAKPEQIKINDDNSILIQRQIQSYAKANGMTYTEAAELKNAREQLKNATSKSLQARLRKTINSRKKK